MTLHKITTKALLKVLPGRWRRRPTSQNARPQRQLEHVILDLLRAHRHKGYMSVGQLADYLYGDEDGGSEWAVGTIRTKIWYLRLAGHPISSVYRWGYLLNEKEPRLGGRGSI